jgi:hypothetical protein
MSRRNERPSGGWYAARDDQSRLLCLKKPRNFRQQHDGLIMWHNPREEEPRNDPTFF